MAILPANSRREPITQGDLQEIYEYLGIELNAGIGGARIDRPLGRLILSDTAWRCWLTDGRAVDWSTSNGIVAVTVGEQPDANRPRKPL